MDLPRPAWFPAALADLLAGRDLAAGAVTDAFRDLLAGKVEEPLAAALLTALRMKGVVRRDRRRRPGPAGADDPAGAHVWAGVRHLRDRRGRDRHVQHQHRRRVRGGRGRGAGGQARQPGGVQQVR
ncbi:MAG: hypothetical protein U0871_06515 [Gemmataceae bacterium]